MRKHHLGNASSKWLKVARVIHFLMFPEYKNVTFIHSLPSPSLPPPTLDFSYNTSLVF